MKRQGSAGPIVIQQQRAEDTVGDQPSEEVLRRPTITVRSGHQPRGRGPTWEKDADGSEHHENAAKDDPNDSHDGVGAWLVIRQDLVNDLIVGKRRVGFSQCQRGLFSSRR